MVGMERGVLPPDPSGLHPVRNAIVKFYNVRGEHIYTLDTPAQVTQSSLLGLEWFDCRVYGQRKLQAF